MNKDFSGNPIFIVKDDEHGVEFFPYSLDTIHEYIKAKQELKESQQEKSSGAV